MLNRNRFTLSNIYGAETKQLKIALRSLVGDPTIGQEWTRKLLIDALTRASHAIHLLPEADFDLHNSKSMQFLLSIPDAGIDSLIKAHKIALAEETKELKALRLYEKGISFHDLAYAYSNQNELITGSNQEGSGVYDVSGKVEKDHLDDVDIIYDNPYSYLSVKQLRAVANTREIHIPQYVHQAVFVRMLSDLDKIFPKWINSINARPEDLPSLYVKAGLNHINIKSFDVGTLSVNDYIKLIELGRIINRNTPPLLPRKDYKQFPNINRLGFSEAYDLALEGNVFKENNIGFVFSIFGHPKNKREIIDYFTEIALYPPNVDSNQYLTLTLASPNMLRKLLKDKYKTDDVFFLDDNALLFLSSRSYIPPGISVENIKKRYEETKNYPNSLLEKLYLIYDVNDMYELAKQTPNPIEKIIVSFKLNVIDKLIQGKDQLAMEYGAKIGMIIPPTNEHKVDYFWTNVTQYDRVMIRERTEKLDKNLLSGEMLTDDEVGQLLSHYTDQEIFAYTGIYIPYTSRGNLIAKITNARRVKTFFIPTVRSCINQTTITTLDETNDPNQFIVGYGTIFSYYCYNFDDFLENFKEYPIADQINFRFRKPDTLADNFSNVEIRSLVRLLKIYPNTQEVVNVLLEGLAKVYEVTEYDRDIQVQFLQMVNKLTVREWLLQLFNIGMYMRRWQGPPHPYPVILTETQGDIDPNLKVNEAMALLGYFPVYQGQVGEPLIGIAAKLSEEERTFMNNLRAVEYMGEDGRVKIAKQKDNTIGFYLSRVRKGDMCIRMASSIFIGTGYYYLRLFFKELIPNFEPTQLDRIM